MGFYEIGIAAAAALTGFSADSVGRFCGKRTIATLHTSMVNHNYKVLSA